MIPININKAKYQNYASMVLPVPGSLGAGTFTLRMGRVFLSGPHGRRGGGLGANPAIGQQLTVQGEDQPPAASYTALSRTTP